MNHSVIDLDSSRAPLSIHPFLPKSFSEGTSTNSWLNWTLFLRLIEFVLFTNESPCMGWSCVGEGGIRSTDFLLVLLSVGVVSTGGLRTWGTWILSIWKLTDSLIKIVMSFVHLLWSRRVSSWDAARIILGAKIVPKLETGIWLLSICDISNKSSNKYEKVEIFSLGRSRINNWNALMRSRSFGISKKWGSVTGAYQVHWQNRDAILKLK